MSENLTPEETQRIEAAMAQIEHDSDDWPTGEMVETIAAAAKQPLLAELRRHHDLQPDDAVFSARTMQVLSNMGEKMLGVRRPMPGADETREQWRTRSQAFDTNHADMAYSLGTVLKYLATPGVRLWPDNGREDCLSLSGSLGGMSFGIIWSPNADGTGRWTFHS